MSQSRQSQASNEPVDKLNETFSNLAIEHKNEMPKEPRIRRATATATSINVQEYDPNVLITEVKDILNYDIHEVELNQTHEEHRIVSFLLYLSFWVNMKFRNILQLATDGFICRLKDQAIVGECYSCGNMLNNNKPKQDTLKVHRDTCAFLQGEAGNESIAPIRKRKLEDLVKKYTKIIQKQSNVTRPHPYARPETNIEEQPSTSRQRPVSQLEEPEDEDSDVDLYSAPGETTQSNSGSYLSLLPPEDIESQPLHGVTTSAGRSSSRSPGSVASTIQSSTSHFPAPRGMDIQLGPAMYTHMQDPVSRILSFHNPNWKNVKRTRNFRVGDKDFGLAGFFYQGIGDTITCFYCGGELKDILASDVPHVIHIFSFPRCDFMLKKYGPEEIARIQSTNPNANETSVALLPRETIKDVVTEPQALPPPVPRRQQSVETTRQQLLTEAMATPHVHKIINGMRFERAQVEDVILKKIRKDNCYYETAEALINALARDVDELSDPEDEPAPLRIRRPGNRPPTSTFDRRFYNRSDVRNSSVVSYPSYPAHAQPPIRNRPQILVPFNPRNTERSSYTSSEISALSAATYPRRPAANTQPTRSLTRRNSRRSPAFQHHRSASQDKERSVQEDLRIIKVDALPELPTAFA